MEREQATELIHNLLRGMLSKKASDLFITAGFPGVQDGWKVDAGFQPGAYSGAYPGAGAQYHE